MNVFLRIIENSLRVQARKYPHNPAAISLIHFGMNASRSGRRQHARSLLEVLHRIERREVVHRGNHALAIVAMVRGEDAYLPDWIDFHLKQGVTQFYLYDNAVNEEDAERTFQLLERQILGDKTVSYIRWPDVAGCRVGCVKNADRSINTLQDLAFYDFKSRFGGDTVYYLKLDVDEYLFHSEGGRIPDLFPFRGTHPLHGFNFGSSGNTHRSPEPDWKRFLRREESASHVKSISRSRDVYESFNAHLAFDKPWIHLGFRSSLHQARRQHIRSHLRLHHYKLKSLEEFIERRIQATGYVRGDYSLEDFGKLDGPMSVVHDDSLARLQGCNP